MIVDCDTRGNIEGETKEITLRTLNKILCDTIDLSLIHILIVMVLLAFMYVWGRMCCAIEQATIRFGSPVFLTMH